MTLLRFASRSRGDYLEAVAETDVVSAGCFRQLMDKIADVMAAEPKTFSKALLEVIAPKSEITVFERFHTWNRVFPVIQRTRVAFLVTGRPLGADAKFFELVAYNRGVALKFFATREEAIKWLNVSAEEAGDAA